MPLLFPLGINYLVMSPKFSSLKQHTFLSSSVGQESESDNCGFWFRVSNEVAGKMTARAAVIRSLAGAGQVSSNMAHLRGCWQDALASCYMGLSVGLLECLRHTAAVFPRANDLRERETGLSKHRSPAHSAQAALVWGRLGANRLWSVFQ